MKVIVITDDELQRLEKRFGSVVRHMGPWTSDGTFGYSSVPMFAVEKAAEALENPDLMAALSHLGLAPERTFIELLEAFGPALIERIVGAYRECPLESITGTRLASKPIRAEIRRVSVATAAG